MTDKEIFEKYCEKQKIPNTIKSFTPIFSVFYRANIESTYSYKLFKLQIAIQELKQSIKDAISEIILTIRGKLK